MGFQINDLVSYHTTGVCKIMDIKTENLAGKASKYYILKPVHQESSTVYVPAENEQLVSKMRKLLTREEIYQIIDETPAYHLVWIDDEKARQKAFKEIVTGGDRRELIGLIRTLYQKQRELTQIGRKLHTCDERIMQEAEKLLHDEFSVAIGIQPEEVIAFITKRLKHHS